MVSCSSLLSENTICLNSGIYFKQPAALVTIVIFYDAAAQIPPERSPDRPGQLIETPSGSRIEIVQPWWAALYLIWAGFSEGGGAAVVMEMSITTNQKEQTVCMLLLVMPQGRGSPQPPSDCFMDTLLLW